MVRVPLFKPCDMEYNAYDKPIRYTEEFLKELASNSTGCKLVLDEHNSKSIGKVSNLTFNDGELFGDVSTEHSTDNYQYSPSYDCKLIDKGDYWLASNGKLVEIAMTTEPRQAILNNTAEEGGSNMGENTNDTTIQILNDQIKDLNKQLAIANNKLEANKEKLKAYDELVKERDELKEWKETNEKLIEEQKPIIEEYNKAQTAKKEELLEKISNGNSEIKAKLENMNVADLETIAGLESHDVDPKGIGANNAQGLNKGDGSNDKEAEQKARAEAVEGMFGDLFTKEE